MNSYLAETAFSQHSEEVEVTGSDDVLSADIIWQSWEVSYVTLGILQLNIARRSDQGRIKVRRRSDKGQHGWIYIRH